MSEVPRLFGSALLGALLAGSIEARGGLLEVRKVAGSGVVRAPAAGTAMSSAQCVDLGSAAFGGARAGRLVARVAIADSFGTRLVGLSRVREPKGDDGLLFPHCSNVHCLFMHVPIDVVSLATMQVPTSFAPGAPFIGRMYRVTGVETVAPRHFARRCRGTDAILELSSGAAAGLSCGEVLLLKIREAENVTEDCTLRARLFA